MQSFKFDWHHTFNLVLEEINFSAFSKALRLFFTRSLWAVIVKSSANNRSYSSDPLFEQISPRALSSTLPFSRLNSLTNLFSSSRSSLSFLTSASCSFSEFSLSSKNAVAFEPMSPLLIIRRESRCLLTVCSRLFTLAAYSSVTRCSSLSCFTFISAAMLTADFSLIAAFFLGGRLGVPLFVTNRRVMLLSESGSGERESVCSSDIARRLSISLWASESSCWSSASCCECSSSRVSM
mmetsp:Transcript_39069/g.93553  ORF Transcript_39069/g.93553 Transcript_39069/m.93553 type:complete len:237 (+) Transcript_39069:138-848(+)